MAIETLEIFLASSFDEHRNLRKTLRERVDGHPILPMRAIDLDDHRARHRPPLEQSLDSVRRADVVVVLVGTTYGGCPSGASESYTHLEYREASARATGSVLVYLIGYEGADEARAAPDSRLAAWCRELLENHTPAFFAAGTGPDTIVESILLDVQAAVFLTLSASQRRALDVYEMEDSEWDGPTRQELESLSERFEFDREPESRPQIGLRPEDAPLSPARAAALEQQREASRALDLGERSIAAMHLRRAFDLVPLDRECNYWLARLLLTTGRRQDCRDALTHALRASRLARTEGEPFAAALALLAASQSASRVGDHASGVAHAQAAVEEAGWYAGCHLELAARQAEGGDLTAAEEAIEAAFFRHPPATLRSLHREPGFRRHPGWIHRVREQLRGRVDAATRAVLAEERKTAESTETPFAPPPELNGRRILPLLAAARESALRQISTLQDLSRATSLLVDDRRRLVRTKESELSSLEQDQRRQREELAKQQPGVRFDGTVGGFLLGLLFAAVTQQVMLLVIALAAGVGLDVTTVTWRRRRFAEIGRSLATRHETASELAKNELATSRSDLRELAGTLDIVVNDRLTALENTAAAWAILSPTRGVGSARAGDLVRLDPARLPEDYRIELDPLHLPPDLRDVVQVAPAPPGHRLFRVLQRNGDRLVAARWASVFEPVPNSGPKSVV